MTDRITELAKKVGAIRYGNWNKPYEATWGCNDEQLQRFAALVRAEALEDAAKACRELVNDDNTDDYTEAAEWCAIRIIGLKK